MPTGISIRTPSILCARFSVRLCTFRLVTLAALATRTMSTGFVREVAATAATTPLSAAEPLVVAYVTAPSEEKAETLATGLVESKLAACVNILPAVKSIYRWEGEISKDDEVLMIIKTKESLQREVVDWIRRNHPYTVPETIFLPINAGNPAYLQWVLDNTKGEAGKDGAAGKKDEL
jgi:periplasmic divalent cation tolerance protein